MKKAPFTNLTATAVELAARSESRTLDGLVGDLRRQVERMRLIADDTERSMCEGDPVHRAFFNGRICCLREQAMNIEDILANNAVSGAAESSGYVCTMDADCMPECCAQWRRGGGCANTGGDCKFRKPASAT